MSDFDRVLERLFNDPAFAAALAADPDGVLAGFRLDADEAALLRSQAGADTGARSAAVESRVTTSSTFGLLSPFAVAGGLSGMLAEIMPGAAGVTDGFGAAPGGGSGTGAGGVPGRNGAHSGLGAAPPADAESAVARLGDAPRSGLGGAGGGQGLGDAPSAFGAEVRQIAPPEGYENWVDADGDGSGDVHTLRGRADGGVDILVDVNRDGQTDFVGHDVDGDRTVDTADYDSDHDGAFERRMFDDDGDGLLDRSVRLRP